MTATPTSGPRPFAHELDSLHSSLPYAFDDRVLLQLRLALALGERNLVLRVGSPSEPSLTKAQRHEATKRVAQEVAWMCSTIFGLTTNQIECSRKTTSPNAFLRSWFLSSSTNPLTSGAGPPASSSAATPATPKPLRSEPAATSPQSRRRMSRNTSNAPALSVTIPPPLGLGLDGEGSPLSSAITPTTEPNLRNEKEASVGSSFSSHVDPSATSGSRSPVADRILGRDPTSSPRSVTPRRATSGLEPSSPSIYWDAASASVRRPSTASTYTSPAVSARTISTAPSRASMVNSKDTPSHLPLDYSPSMNRTLSSDRRRASSAATTDLSPTAKHLPQVVILERLDRTLPRVQQLLLTIFQERQITMKSPASLKRSADAAAGTAIRSRRTAAEIAHADEWEGTWNLPDRFLCVGIVCCSSGEGEDDGAWGGVSRYLLDQFTLSHTIPTSAFRSSVAFRAPASALSHPLSAPLLSPEPFPSLILPRSTSDALENYQNDLISTLRHHPLLESRMLTACASLELTRTVQAWIVLRGGEKTVLPSDVVAVLLGVVGHRLRVREPRHEKSVFWGSEPDALAKREERELGVEGVVRSVVAEV